jgi:hypothetical protein
VAKAIFIGGTAFVPPRGQSAAMNPVATWIFEIVFSLLPVVVMILIQVTTNKTLQLTSTEFFVSSLVISLSTTTALMTTLSKKKLSLNDFWTSMTFYSFQVGTLFITVFLAISIINPLSWLIGIGLEICIAVISYIAHRRFIWR